MLKGENLYLSKIEKEDMNCIYKWFADSEFLKYYDYVTPVPQSKDEVYKTFSDYEKNDESKVFAIKINKSNEIIGIAGFDDIVSDNGVATMFIGIGSEEHRGKGYGRESLNLLLSYGFFDMNLFRIQLNVLEFNSSAIRLYERAGFKREGALREFVLRDCKRYDLFLYGLLKREWKSQ